MKIKNYILAIVVIMFTTIVRTQTTPKFQWVRGGGSMGNTWNQTAQESCKWIGTDARGNVYGMSSIFDYGIQIDTSYRPVGWGYDDFAVFSYRCDGSLRWVRYFGSSSQDLTGGYTVDLQGNSYVSGFVSVNYDWFENGFFGDTTIIATPGMNCGNFIAKIDSNGHTVYVKFIDTPTFTLGLRIINMESDNQGNQCILVRFFNAGNWGNYTIPEKGFYIVRVNKDNGTIMDVTRLDFNRKSGSIENFSVDNENSYYVSELVIYDDTLYMGGNVITTGNNDSTGIYILAKFSPTGNLIWHKEILCNFIDPNYIINVVVGKMIIVNDYLYIQGNAQKNGSVFGYTINNPFIAYPWVRTGYIAKFNKTTGDFHSFKQFYNILNPFINVRAHYQGKIYCEGITLRVLMTNLNDTIKPYGGTYDKAFPFVVEIDTGLTHFNWGIATRATGDYTRIESMTVDLAGNIYVGGQVSDSIYDSFGSAYLSHGGAEDFFIAKISANNNCGCIKSQPYPQLLSTIGNTITVKGTATGLPDSLYWSWGDGTTTAYSSHNSVITHTYATGGNYNVCLHTLNYCGTKDSCIAITGLGINEQDLKYLKLYPNPVNSTFTIENPYQCSMQVNIRSITGRLLSSHHYHDTTATIDISHYENGIYFIEILLSDGRKAMKKIVKIL